MEFTSPNGGGLLTLVTTDDGRLLVEIHNCDPTVIVRGPSNDKGRDPRPVIAFLDEHRTRYSDQEFRHAVLGRCLWLREYGTSRSELCVYAALSGSLFCANHRDALADANPNTYGVKIPTDV